MKLKVLMRYPLIFLVNLQGTTPSKGVMSNSEIKEIIDELLNEHFNASTSIFFQGFRLCFLDAIECTEILTCFLY
jgi:hypothetical protein